MIRKISTHLILLALAISIVLPVNSSVKNLFSNGAPGASMAALSGNPLPAPPPPGFGTLAASGNPLPAPPPPGLSVLAASGNPLPAPPPPGYAA